VIYGNSQIGSETNIINSIPQIIKILFFEMNYNQLDYYNVITKMGNIDSTITIHTGIDTNWTKDGTNGDNFKLILEAFFNKSYKFNIKYSDKEDWKIFNTINKMNKKLDNEMFVKELLTYKELSTNYINKKANIVKNMSNEKEITLTSFNNSILYRFAITNRNAQSKITLFESKIINESGLLGILNADPDPKVAYKILLETRNDKITKLIEKAGELYTANMKMYKSHLNYSIKQIATMKNWDIVFKSNNKLQIVVSVGTSPEEAASAE
jgi:hypothetical protein